MKALPDRALARGAPPPLRPIASMLTHLSFISYARICGIVAVIAFAAAAPGFATSKPDLHDHHSLVCWLHRGRDDLDHDRG